MARAVHYNSIAAGSTLTTANTGHTTFSGLSSTAFQVAAGDNVARHVAGVSSQCITQETFSSTANLTWAGEIYLRTVATAAGLLLTFRNSTVAICDFLLNTNRTVVLRASGTAVFTSTAIPLDTRVKIYITGEPGTTSSNGKIKGKITSMDGTTVYGQGELLTANMGTTPLIAITWGVLTSATDGAYDFDNINWTEGTYGYIEPVNPSANAAPTASAGPDQAVNTGNTVTLTGTASDSDGSIASTAWTQTAGTTVTLSGTGLTRTFTPTVTGSYTFQFTATDNLGAQSSDTVVITVTDTPPPPTSPVSHYNTAEGGSNGTTLTAANSGAGSGYAFQLVTKSGAANIAYSSTNPAHGTLNYLVTAGASELAGVVWNVTTKRLATRAYMRIPSYPTVATQICLITAADTGTVARLFMATNGQIGLQATASTLPTQMLTGIPPLNTWFRAELFCQIGATADTGKVGAAWGVGDGAWTGTYPISTVSAGTGDILNVQWGKMNATSWDATIQLDDLAANSQATTFIGPYAASYTVPAILRAEQVVEPWETVTLNAEGTGTWTQVSGTGVLITEGTGNEATYVAPPSLTGGDLTFAFGGAQLTDTVLPATDATWNGTAWVPSRLIVGNL